MPSGKSVETIAISNSKHLHETIQEHIQRLGPWCSLNHLDVSRITNMDGLFANSPFNGDISDWDTSKVTSAIGMFLESAFDGDISKWNMDELKFATDMFKYATFGGDISAWRFAKPGPGSLTGAFYSKHFQSDMPRLKTFGCLKAALHPAYAGSFHEEYTLAMAQQLFEVEWALEAHLASAAGQGLNRLHVEYLIQEHVYAALHKRPAEKPSWCPADVFEKMKHEKELGVGLGMDLYDICAAAYQRLTAPTTPSIGAELFQGP